MACLPVGNLRTGRSNICTLINYFAKEFAPNGVAVMVPTPKTISEPTSSTPVNSEEESLVPDTRGQLTPAQMVDRKLVTVVHTCPLLVSHLRDSVKRRPR